MDSSNNMSFTNRNAILLRKRKAQNSGCLHAADDRLRWSRTLLETQEDTESQLRKKICRPRCPYKQPKIRYLEEGNHTSIWGACRKFVVSFTLFSFFFFDPCCQWPFARVRHRCPDRPHLRRYLHHRHCCHRRRHDQVFWRPFSWLRGPS